MWAAAEVTYAPPTKDGDEDLDWGVSIPALPVSYWQGHPIFPTAAGLDHHLRGAIGGDRPTMTAVEGASRAGAEDEVGQVQPVEGAH